MDSKLKEEINDRVDQLIQKHTHVLREQIMQILTESDKDKTQCLSAINVLKYEILKQSKEQEEILRKELTAEIEREIEASEKHIREKSQSTLQAHTAFITDIVQKNKISWPKAFMTIVAIIGTLISPFAIMLYDCYQDLWALRLEFVALQSTIKDSHDLYKDKPIKDDLGSYTKTVLPATSISSQ